MPDLGLQVPFGCRHASREYRHLRSQLLPLDVTTGSLKVELGLLVHHVVGVLRSRLNIDYLRGLISVNWRSLNSIHCINSDAQVVDPGLAQILLKNFSLWSMLDHNFIIWWLTTRMSIQLLFLIIANLRTVDRNMLLMHASEPSIL